MEVRLAQAVHPWLVGHPGQVEHRAQVGRLDLVEHRAREDRLDLVEHRAQVGRLDLVERRLPRDLRVLRRRLDLQARLQHHDHQGTRKDASEPCRGYVQYSRRPLS